MGEAQALTLALKGRWYRTYGLACCPAHSDRRPSLSLADAPDGRLLLNCKAGCSFEAVISVLRGAGMLKGGGAGPTASPDVIAKRKADAEREAAKIEARALATWNEAAPAMGTLAHTYLRARGITCALPDTLRFHPKCWHPSAKKLPAMVARIEGLPRMSIHRTYLQADGSKKANVEPPKAMQGAAKGGAVRLSTSEEGPLVVAEGLETALSLSSGLLEQPYSIWAALSCAGMSSLRLPDKRASGLIVASDGDTPGREAARQLASRAYAQGWTVKLLEAPEGQDWNDVLMSEGAHS